MPGSTESCGQDVEPQLRPVQIPMDRRTFLVWAAGASLGAAGVFIAATVIQAMEPPARSIAGKKNPGRVAVARISDLKINEPKLTEYGEDRIFVVKTSGTEAVVFSAACPHIGCELVFNEKANQFECPCHSSTFSIGGVRLSGPAPRNMIAAKSQIEAGEVIVSGFEA